MTFTLVGQQVLPSAQLDDQQKFDYKEYQTFVDFNFTSVTDCCFTVFVLIIFLYTDHILDY